MHLRLKLAVFGMDKTCEWKNIHYSRESNDTDDSFRSMCMIVPLLLELKAAGHQLFPYLVLLAVSFLDNVLMLSRCIIPKIMLIFHINSSR